jgi:hypothetical protein
MTRQQIARASTAALNARLESIVPLIGTEYEDDYPSEAEEIGRELERREHDLRDPSSGLGMHQPS